MADDEVQTKLSAARARLILDKPFLGALVLRLPLRPADARWCPTTATDARTLFYNPDYVQSLSVEQTQFMLAHEALHCALSHFARREHRVRQRWDVACDLAVNPLLLKDGLKSPPGALVRDGFSEMSAEEIYPFIEENPDEQPLDGHLYDADDSGSEGESKPQDGTPQDTQPDGAEDGESGAAPRPAPLGESERERLAAQWRQRLAGAAQEARRAGKLSGAMERMVNRLLRPQLSWRALLARYLTGVARDDYNYTRPARREGDAILPSLRSSQVDVTVVVDTSGSVTPEEMNDFIAEVNGLKAQMRARVTLHACDTELAPDGPWSFEPWEEFRLPRALRGGGGTRFTPVFDWVERQDMRPDVLVYFTDAHGEFPKTEPSYPVVWLVKGKGAVPWGERVQLN
ncbi:MAG: VWA-like domain-containing protein [Gammaproteobacteria bacterium]|jgi:predicted metal-dependent peptidase